MYRPNYFMLKRAADKNKDDSGDVWKPLVGGLLGAGIGGTAGYYLSAPSNKTVGTAVGVVGGGLAGAAAGQHSRQKKVQQKKKLQKQKQEQKNLDYLKSMALSTGVPAAAGGLGLGARQAIRGWKMPISEKLKYGMCSSLYLKVLQLVAQPVLLVTILVHRAKASPRNSIIISMLMIRI